MVDWNYKQNFPLQKVIVNALGWLCFFSIYNNLSIFPMEGYGTRERMLTTMGVVKNIKSPNLLYILGHIDNIFVQQIKYIIKLLWLQWLLKNLGVSIFSTTHFYCNNQSIIHITHHERTKHIKIDCHFISYHLVISVSSQDQLTNIFTKSHPKGCFCTLVDNLKLVSHLP